MSCSCGNHCAPGCGCLYQVFLPENPVSTYEFSNVNLNGIGVLDAVSGQNVEFRGIVAGSPSLLMTLDAGNHSIVITIDPEALIVDIPQATTTQRGIGETATDAEAQAKVSTTVFLTPSNLAALGASTTLAGLVELATDAETQAGISTTLAVTPAGLASVTQLLETTTTFADAVGRAAAFPAFEGQFGVQLDTNTAYLADGTGAGDWLGILTLDSSANTMTGNTNLTPNGFTFEVSGNGGFAINLTTFTVANSTSNFNNGNLRFGDTGALNFDWAANVILQISGSTIPADSVLITSGTNGDPDSKLISEFLSSDNTNTGWTNFTNSAVRKTGDCNTITLPQLAQVVDTLIQTLGTSLQTPVP